MAGIYRLSESSRAFLATHRRYESIPDPTIILREDGSVVVKRLPDCAAALSGESNGRFLDGSGHWTIDSIDYGYSASLSIDAGSTLPPGTYENIEIRGKRPPYVLELGLGDPDQGESLTYQKDVR